MKPLKAISLCMLIFFFVYACDNVPITPSIPEIKSPVPISSVIPVDVDPAIQAKLMDASTNFYALNQEFNKFSWQALVAIFWPLNSEGAPMDNFTDKGKSTWLTWKEAFQVYHGNGGIPELWGSPRTRSGYKHDTDIEKKEHLRIYLTQETPAHKGISRNIVDEIDQAFAGRLFDQAGNTVVYEVLMNKAEYDYLFKNKLYNVNGQVAFSADGSIANFPKGDFATQKVGAIEIKVAWKVLTANDYKKRYYQNRGLVPNADGNLVEVDLGMIGFHISQKTPTGSQWVWSTFEHIDNLKQNTIEKDGKQIPIHPTLTDPSCEMCPVNVDLYVDGKVPAIYAYGSDTHGNFWYEDDDTTYAKSDKMITQAKRMINIPVRVQQLNKKMQAYFKSINSVFQYYELIDTQYPTDQDAPPGNNSQAGYTIPGSIANKSGGNPNITYLTNITMETFFQGGNQSGTSFMENNDITGLRPATNVNVFGTEGCMGCHSSAGLHTSLTNINQTGPQLSGDFSWLLSQKAKIDSSLLKLN